MGRGGPGGKKQHGPPPPLGSQPTCEHCTTRCCPTASGAHRCVCGGGPQLCPLRVHRASTKQDYGKSIYGTSLFPVCVVAFSSQPRKSPPTTAIWAVPSPPPTASASYLPQLLWGRGGGGCRGASASRRGARGRGGGVKGCWGRAPPPPGKSRRGRQRDRRFISRAGGWAHRAAGPLLPPGRSEDIKKMAPNRIDTPLTHTP